MPASLVASFLVFAGTGLYVFFFSGAVITGSRAADLFIYFTLLANASYFYYFEAYAEIDETEHTRLSKLPPWEWRLRVANHAILISLWFALDHSIWWFLVLLIVFYALMILWDLLTDDKDAVQLPNRPMLAKWDVIGLILTLLFFADVLAIKQIEAKAPLPALIVSMLGKDPLRFPVLALGAICIGYIWLVRAASAGQKFRLRDHFHRPNLR